MTAFVPGVRNALPARRRWVLLLLACTQVPGRKRADGMWARGLAAAGRLLDAKRSTRDGP